MNDAMPMGMRIGIIHRFFRKQMDRRLREQELTGVQFGVLRALESLERSGLAEVNQRDLENVSRVTHPTMTEIIKRLEKKEFIVCRQSGKDRRYKCISSTDKALRLRDEIVETDQSVNDMLCRGLSQAQIDQFLSLTDLMLENVFNNTEGGDCCLDKKAFGQRPGV